VILAVRVSVQIVLDAWQSEEAAHSCERAGLAYVWWTSAQRFDACAGGDRPAQSSGMQSRDRTPCPHCALGGCGSSNVLPMSQRLVGARPTICLPQACFCAHRMTLMHVPARNAQ
jgi:hypothetical protein